MPQFTKGSSGNPLGRPPGSKNRSGLADRLDKMVTAAAEDIVGELLARARAGDSLASDVLLARVWPARNGAEDAR